MFDVGFAHGLHGRRKCRFFGIIAFGNLLDSSTWCFGDRHGAPLLRIAGGIRDGRSIIFGFYRSRLVKGCALDSLDDSYRDLKLLNLDFADRSATASWAALAR